LDITWHSLTVIFFCRVFHSFVPLAESAVRASPRLIISFSTTGIRALGSLRWHCTGCWTGWFKPLSVGKQTSHKYTQITYIYIYYVYLFVWHILWRSIGFYFEVQFGFNGISRGKSTTGDLAKQNGNVTSQFGCYPCYLARRVWRVSVSRCGFLYPNP
jgi:hypothetical protein